jgi:hypothetical protein
MMVKLENNHRKVPPKAILRAPTLLITQQQHASKILSMTP